MAKAKQTRNRKEFYASTLQGTKVGPALDTVAVALDVDAGDLRKAFQNAYVAERKTREAQPILERFTPEQVAKIREFETHGDTELLASDLGVKPSGIDKIVSRAFQEGVFRAA